VGAQLLGDVAARAPQLLGLEVAHLGLAEPDSPSVVGLTLAALRAIRPDFLAQRRPIYRHANSLDSLMCIGIGSCTSTMTSPQADGNGLHAAWRASTLARMRALGLSQNEISRRVKRHQGTVSKLLNGKWPSRPLRLQIEAALLKAERRSARR
jgi:hypothetical protein